MAIRHARAVVGLALLLGVLVTTQTCVGGAPVTAFSSLIWVSSGISLAAALLWGAWVWPAIALASFVAVDLGDHSLPAAFAIAALDVGEALLARHLLLGRFGFRRSLERVQDVAALIAVVVAVPGLATAFEVVARATLEPERGISMFATWTDRWWGHVAADLLITPFLLTWSTRAARERNRHDWLEMISLAVTTVVTCAMVFDRRVTDWLPGSREPYYVVPVLVWAGLRFGLRGATAATLAVGGFAIVGTASGEGPFVQLADLQSFLAVSSVTTLMMSALAFERLQAVRRQSAIQRSALDAIVTIDEDGRVLEMNPAGERLFGYREASVIGKELAPLIIPPELRDVYRAGLATLAAGGDSPVVDRRLRIPALRADGSTFSAELSVARVAVDSHFVLTGFVRDVTAETIAEVERQHDQEELARRVEARTAELRETNTELAHKEELLRQAQELAHIGSFDLDVAHDRAEWSEEMFQIHGRDPAAFRLTYASSLSTVHGADRAAVRATMERALADRQPFSGEHRIVRPDGTVRTLQTQGRVSDDGRGVRITGCSQDITDRKLAEHARERLGELVASSEDAIIGLSLDGVMETWNASATKIFGYESADAIGRPVTMLVAAPDRSEVAARVAAVRQGHRLAHYDLAHVRRDGRPFDASVTTSAIVDHDGRVIGISKVVRDITERKATEVRLRASLAEKDILLREIYHRVKNNLQVISSLLNLQVASEPSEQARRGLLESQSRIQSMALVHQLLYQSPDLARIDFSEYLRNLCGRLIRTYNVGADRVTLDVNAESVLVDIDRAIPGGLIVNELVSNALGHAFPDDRQGHLWVTLVRDGELLRLEVRDDGIGLPAGVDPESGHSFGFQIARTLTSQISGTIEITSDHGVTVRVVFPLSARAKGPE